MNKNKFKLITFDKQIEGAPICKKNVSRGYVNWGQKNDYPLKLSELYYNSIVHKSCVDFGVTAIMGGGIDYEKMAQDKTQFVPNLEYTWDIFVKNIALDYILYGSFAFQIIKNKDGRTFSFYHQPISSVRSGIRNSEGIVDTYYLSNDWTTISKFPPVAIDAFLSSEKVKSGKPYLFVYKTYTPDLEYYSAPYYVGAIKAIMTELELIRYDLRSVKNNFSANGFMVLPEMETEEEKQQILRQIKDSFVGADNANSLIITFSDQLDKADEIAKFIKIDKDSDNVDLFSQNNDRNIDRIVTAHRIPNKELIGMPTDGAQLGGKGNILRNAWKLYSITVANENRKVIANTINKLLRMNGIDIDIQFLPLDFDENMVDDKVNDNDNDTIDENNIKENEGNKVNE